MEDENVKIIVALCREHRKANSKNFDEVKMLIGKQNSRIRENEKALAGLKVWVPVVGAMAAIASAVGSAVVQMMAR